MRNLIAITIILLSAVMITSCKKEFSFEGNINPVVIDSTGRDSIPTTVNTDSSYIDPALAKSNTWHFTDSMSHQYFSGIFKTAALQSSFQDSVLYVLGYDANIPTDTAFIVDMFFDNGKIQPGIYPCDELHRNEVTLEASNDAIYSVNGVPGFFNKTPSYITIISYDEVTKNIVGSFHCWGDAYDANYFPALITGSFNCRIQ